MPVRCRVVWFVGLVAAVAALAPGAEPPGPRLPEGAVARLGSSRLRHAAPATCVTFSPDGKGLVSGGADGAVRVWDVATGEQRTSALWRDARVEAVRFTHRGTRLAVLFSDGAIRFLDPATLRQLATFDSAPLTDFDVSPDGSLLATVGVGGGLVVTELATGLPKLELDECRLVRFHPDGKHVAVADPKGVVTLYQVTGGKPVFSAKHGGPLNGLAFHPDGKVFATGGAGPDGRVKLWEVGKPEPVAVIPGAAGWVTFLGDDRMAAAKGPGHGVYDLKKRSWVRTIADAAGVAAVSPDGSRLAAVGQDAVRVRIWDTATGEQLHAKGDAVPDAALLVPTADGRSLFVVAADRAYTWRIGDTVPTLAGKFPGPVSAATTGGKRLAAATTHGLDLYDGFDPVKPLPEKPARSVENAGGSVKVVALSADGRRLAYAGEDKQVWLADPATGKALRVLPIPVPAGALALAFSPAGDRLAVLAQNGFLRLWKLGDEKDEELWLTRVPQVRRFHRGTVAVSPDGRLVAASASRRLVVLDAANKSELFAVDQPGDEDGIFQTAAFTPDSRSLVVGSGGLSGTVQVWDVTSQQLVRRYTTTLGGVNRLVVFPDGTRAASAGSDDAVTVWDLASRPK